MIWLYRFLFLPALIIAAPFYLLRMKRRGGYSQNFGQRFGRCPSLSAKNPDHRRIWLQAVSVGEMLAIGPLLESLKKDGSVEVYLTTTTSTGYKLAQEKYRSCTLAIAYFPLDWWLFSARAWRQVNPDLVLLTEGERWPEHVHQAAKRSIPVFCINARLSDRSYRRLKAFPLAAKLMLGGTTRVLACSEHDASRFRDIGCVSDAVTTTGNIKLDLSIPLIDALARTALIKELGFAEQPLLIGASTWPGEETALLHAYGALRARGVECRLLIVPRHAERREEIRAELEKSGYTFHFRSTGPAPQTVDVCVADTTGELRKLVQLAAVVFVGKSLPPHEQGQTPVEAAALGKPILFGPGMSNFLVIADQLVQQGAARVVRDADALAEQALQIFTDPKQADAMAQAAHAWHRKNQGAMERTLRVIQSALR